jgi:hypothetical protein
MFFKATAGFALSAPAAMLVCACALLPEKSRLPEPTPRPEPLPQRQSAVPATNSALDLPIEQIANSSDGCEVLDRDFPGLRTHPMYGFFKSLSLKQVAALSKGQITPEMLAQAETDLASVHGSVRVNAAASVPTAH